MSEMKQEKVGDEWGKEMSNDVILAPGWGMIRLVDLKEAVECGALIKKFGAGYWVWTITVTDYVAEKGDRTRGIKAGDVYTGVSQEFINWHDTYRKRKLADVYEEEAFNALINETFN